MDRFKTEAFCHKGKLKRNAPTRCQKLLVHEWGDFLAEPYNICVNVNI